MIAARGPVSENKSAKSKALKPSVNANTVKSLHSDKGVDKYPGAAIKSGMNKSVLGALDNLLFPYAVDATYPAPIGTSNLQVASSELKGSEITLENFSTTDTTFVNYIVQTGNPAVPYYRTTLSTMPFEADFVELEVNNPGHQWGIINNTRLNTGVLSDFIPNVYLPGWSANSPLINSNINLHDNGQNPYVGLYTVTTYNSVGTVLNTTVSDANGNCLVSFGAATGVVWWSIEYDQDATGFPRILGMVVTDSGVNALSSPRFPTNLAKHGFSNLQYINSRADKVRMNSMSMVMTSTIPELYQGGNILMAKLMSSLAPAPVAGTPVTWDSFLYSQKISYLSNLEFGGEMMWFPQYNEWTMGHEFGANPITSSSVVNICKITYPSPQGVAVVSLPIQVKINGWIDYTTSDTTIPTSPGIVFIDDWLTAVSILEACYRFTDNPTHNKVKEMIKKAVSFITSGDPYAVAIRKAGGIALKTALGAGLALL